MSSITYSLKNEVRQWILDNPQDDSDAESIGDSSGAMNSFYGKTHSPETKNLLSYLANQLGCVQKKFCNLSSQHRILVTDSLVNPINHVWHYLIIC